ncbi:hypothetical protein Q7689_03745 [Nocardiopsis tropica]|uniref:hypothetical protein n=1 Tax=Nocardiopsis tropica TaxID=109330 RepID=UPI002E83F68C|nr:hypothetical protein [Nocardiopsis tropica]
MGALSFEPDADRPEVLLVVDRAAGVLVGEAIPSDVWPGKWRAAVAHPGKGYVYVRVRPSGEDLVELTQVGTETFTSAYDAKAAIERNRVL